MLKWAAGTATFRWQRISGAASEKEILKKLKKDGFLRIAAPILSVPYDGLVQRYRKYKRRKRLTTAAVCLSAAAVFTVYALYQSYQITLQETIARRNKAQNLCVQAMDQYDSGDKAAAVASALPNIRRSRRNGKLYCT